MLPSENGWMEGSSISPIGKRDRLGRFVEGGSRCAEEVLGAEYKAAAGAIDAPEDARGGARSGRRPRRSA
jgi:hypothetical protein